MTTSQPLGPGQVPSSPLVVGFYSPSVESPSSSDLPQHQAAQASVATGRHSAQDMVNHPPHYKSANGMEVIDVLEAFGLMEDAYLANVVKYVLRHREKGGEEDLKKARWYLDRRVERGKTS